MTSDTATIRVNRHTHDLLTRQARARGTSVASLVRDLAQEQFRAAAIASERDAARGDYSNPAARAEIAEWDDTTSDGAW